MIKSNLWCGEREKDDSKRQSIFDDHKDRLPLVLRMHNRTLHMEKKWRENSPVVNSPVA
jgi:hypothetical protein